VCEDGQFNGMCAFFLPSFSFSFSLLYGFHSRCRGASRRGGVHV
jgi:hypothetical protein